MFVNEENTEARPTDAYGKVISQIAKDGVCPFCSDNLKKYHKNPLEEKKYWWVTDNMYPYQPTKHHRLIIHKEHITHLKELSGEAWTELLAIIKDETKTRSLNGGTLLLRFGDTRFTGASVSHLHANIIQSDPDDSSYDKKKGLITRIG